jgi:hypothetical protein
MRYIGVLVTFLSLSSTALAQGYRGPSRVDFDDRLIKGQTTKAGSVYIYDRQEIDIRSLVRRGRSFRQRIIRTVFEE